MEATLKPPKAAVLPLTAVVNQRSHLVIGGCDTTELAAEFGTPLYLFDEETLRCKCREYLAEFAHRYPQTAVLYAAKAFINPALVSILVEEGLGLDVVSGGELAIAQSVGFPTGKVFFHGNNKGADELRFALRAGVGRVVVDNFYELALLSRIAKEMGRQVPILFRLSPGVDAHSHGHTTTGILDSKFGFPVVTGQAQQAIAEGMASAHLRPVGLHFHLGSPVFELEPYEAAISIVLRFAAEMRDALGFAMEEFSPGGGFAVQYVEDMPAPSTAQYAQAIVSATLLQTEALGLDRPRLIIEPGRAIVGQAGVALYTVGASKDIPGLRKYVSVDGGMADNIRPALYGARYEALVANRVVDAATEVVTIAGRYCESGDILVKDVALPELRPGDVIAIPASGAYCLAMASNYNASLKPAIVLVRDGHARLIRRRETYDDLMRCEVW